MKIIVGLGNPGGEYENTRHNIGRMVVDTLIKKNKFDALQNRGKYQSLATEGKIGKEKLLVLEPETYMNKSGQALKSLITSKKAAENLIVVRDDLDMPLGRFKIMFNRSSGGHRGVESVVKAIRTEGFTQLKLGISPATASGKIKKPQGEAVLDFIIGPFKKGEADKVKKVVKEAAEALEVLITDGRQKAMEIYNQK